MSLSEHALCTGVIRKVRASWHREWHKLMHGKVNYNYTSGFITYQIPTHIQVCMVRMNPAHLNSFLLQNGAKIFDGTPLPVTCERDVFDYLDMEYKEPTERDHA